MAQQEAANHYERGTQHDQDSVSSIEKTRTQTGTQTGTETGTQTPPQEAALPPRDASRLAERSLEAYQFFIITMITISIFGASTFTVIAGEMTDPATIWAPNPPPFTLATVRSFLASAWLCFSLVIGIAGYSSSVLAVLRHRADRHHDATWIVRHWEPMGLATSAILHILIVLAFLLLSLSLVAYVGALGWVIVGFSCVALIAAISLLVVQYRDSTHAL